MTKMRGAGVWPPFVKGGSAAGGGGSVIGTVRSLRLAALGTCHLAAIAIPGPASQRPANGAAAEIAPRLFLPQAAAGLREGPEEKTEVHMGLPSFSFRVLPRRVRGKTHFSACKRASVPRKRVRCSRLQISAKRLRLLADQNSALPVVRGCSSTSRMFETPVRYMTMRSKPRP